MAPSENAPDQQEIEGTPPEDETAPDKQSDQETGIDRDNPPVTPVMAGQMLGTVDTTDVGAGAGAFLENATEVTFDTHPGEIDGEEGEDYEDTEGANPMIRSEEETLELVEAEQEQRDAEHENEQARREAAQEAEQAAAEAREEAIASTGEDNPIEVPTEVAGETGTEDETDEEPVDEEPVEEDDGLFHPADYTVPEVQEFLDSADEAERERVIAEENEREPNGRAGVLNYEPKG